MTYRKKLIEVALPLEAINMESAREKSIRHGHPSTLHLWWARRPLAACRAVLWSSLVDDPSSWPDRFPTEDAQKKERQRLFDILGRITIETDRKGNQKHVVRGLVSWDDINNPKSGVLEAAQREIARCLAWNKGEEPPAKPDAVREYIAKYAPPAYDPFAGGGSIPLEAQRLGLEAHASDLNPVAVLINKALIEIPPKFRDQPPVNPEDRQQIRNWKGAEGLAADVRYYGKWIRDEAFRQIGHLYPKVDLPKEQGSGKGTVVAWIWARTVKCPNPACRALIPITRSFQLSSKKNQEAWIEPVVDRSKNPAEVDFRIATGKGVPPEGTVISRKGVICLCCRVPASLDYVKAEGQAGQISSKMMAIVVDGTNGRTYLPPVHNQQARAFDAEPDWFPDAELVKNSRYVTPHIYGIEKHSDLYTKRQQSNLSLLRKLIYDIPIKIQGDIQLTQRENESFEVISSEYSDAVSTYLAFAVSKMTTTNCSLCTWQTKPTRLVAAFSRQAISMTWDYAESNPFSGAAGDYELGVKSVSEVLERLHSSNGGFVSQQDAKSINQRGLNYIVSTDPPYYDNVPYADLSDIFYVWLRGILSKSYPDILGTMLVPKSEELVADPLRQGGKENSRDFFESGIKQSFSRINDIQNPNYPLTIFYAFKQSETLLSVDKDSETSSTGWETMLEGLIGSSFVITGTWPVRTELLVALKKNKSFLASSIVLVCRPRSIDAAKITRRQFLTELKRQLPPALKLLQQGNVAPVDLAQASIGPGMAIFSQYAAVLENDGSPMRVRTALQLINQILDEFLTEQEGEFDGDTRWALTWFEQYQFGPGQYGDAETLSKAKNTSVQGMVDAGILEAKAGKVRLLKRDELKSDWNPANDSRMPDWEVAQYLIHELDQKGELGAAELLAKLGDRAEAARDLAYRLYSLCDKKGWTQEAIAYNSLVISWPEITRLASEVKQSIPVQQDFGF